MWKRKVTSKPKPNRFMNLKGTEKQTSPSNPEGESERNPRYSATQNQNIDRSDSSFTSNKDITEDNNARSVHEISPPNNDGATSSCASSHYEVSYDDSQSLPAVPLSENEHPTTNLAELRRNPAKTEPSGEANSHGNELKKNSMATCMTSASPTESYESVTSMSKIDHSGRASRYQIKPFRRMVRRLEDILDHSAVTELAQLSEQGPDFVLKVDELRKPFHHLMANWEKDGIVTEGDVDTLLELLEEVEAYEALDLVTEYRSSNSKSSAVGKNSGNFSTAPPGNGWPTIRHSLLQKNTPARVNSAL